ncbi:MAG: membrane protein insertion efficiency factor YidD [Bacteroidota bacterium]
MRHLLLIPIRLYWRMGFLRRSRCCLFKESCSRYVYRTTQEEGLVAGFKALQVRLKQCRPGYTLQSTPEGDWNCHLVDGTVLPEKELAAHMIPPPFSYSTINQFKQR